MRENDLGQTKLDFVKQTVDRELERALEKIDTEKFADQFFKQDRFRGKRTNLTMINTIINKCVRKVSIWSERYPDWDGKSKIKLVYRIRKLIVPICRRIDELCED